MSEFKVVGVERGDVAEGRGPGYDCCGWVGGSLVGLFRDRLWDMLRNWWLLDR